MPRKKFSNDILAANGGLDSPRTLKLVEQLMTTHDLKQAVMYQFILSGSPDKSVYQATMKALIRNIRTKCRAEYFGAYEVGEEKNGLHAHAFVIIETADHFPSDLLDVSKGEFIDRLRKRKQISIRIEPPKNKMHDGQMFARMNTPEKLANCIVWATYALKKRSKDGVPGRETYFGSEFASNIAKREAQRQKYRDALTKSSRPAPAEETTKGTKPNYSGMETLQPINPLTNDLNGSGAIFINPKDSGIQTRPKCPKARLNGSEGHSTMERGSMELTPIQKYVASLYEEAVDLGLDVDAMRKHLLERGVKRTPLQLEDELENVCGFYGYAATHSPKPAISVRDWDKMIG